MSQRAFLIQDVFTFLELLSANDIRPIGPRYLTPSTLTKLNSLLVVPDLILLQHPRKSNGQWRVGSRVRASERHSERIRFIHYLAESSQLVARTGEFLKPTPQTAQWLKRTPQQRAEILFCDAFPAQPSKPDDERWRAFGLPGDHLPSPLVAMNQLLDIFRQVPIDQRIKISTLLKLLDFPTYADDRADHQPEPTLGALLKLLQWFEIITCDHDSMVQLTSMGAPLLDHSDSVAPTTTRTRRAKPLHWSKPRGDNVPELIAPLDADFAILWELGNYATHTATISSTRQTRRLYQLDAATQRSNALAAASAHTLASSCGQCRKSTRTPPARSAARCPRDSARARRHCIAPSPPNRFARTP